MHSVDEARRAMNMLNGMTFMGSRIRVKLDQFPDNMRKRSWDGIIAQEEPDLEDQAASEKISECSGCEQDVSFREPKRMDPHKPLVVDGSGVQKKSVELLSTSAPT
jgi:RNA recognition motif-containing protein